MMVQNPDIIQDASTLVGTPYEGLIPGANDGIIIFEANDYQAGNLNLVIVGAQIAGSDEGITGTATNFNGALDTASSGTQDFSTDVSDAPFKITSIGFLTTSSEDQSATIDFDVTIHDADGDTATTSITVNIGDPVTTLAAAKTSGPSTMEALSSHSLLVSETQEVERVAANSNTVTLAAAVAAAGIVSTSAAASVRTSRTRMRSPSRGSMRKSCLASIPASAASAKRRHSPPGMVEGSRLARTHWRPARTRQSLPLTSASWHRPCRSAAVRAHCSKPLTSPL
jgi:hypothetical protein